MDPDSILQIALELQKYAKEKQLRGMMEGLSYALEQYIEEAATNQETKEELMKIWESTKSKELLR